MKQHITIRRLLMLGLVATLAAGFYSCGHMPWHHGNHSDFVLKHLDRQMGKLDLNDAQKAAYQKMRGEIENDFKRMATERKETAGKIKGELSATTPDMKKVAGFMKEGMKKHPESFEKQIDRLADFYAQLNEAQQQKVREMMIKHMERFDG